MMFYLYTVVVELYFTSFSTENFSVTKYGPGCVVVGLFDGKLQCFLMKRLMFISTINFKRLRTGLCPLIPLYSITGKCRISISIDKYILFCFVLFYFYFSSRLFSQIMHKLHTNLSSLNQSITGRKSFKVNVCYRLGYCVTSHKLKPTSLLYKNKRVQFYV